MYIRFDRLKHCLPNGFRKFSNEHVSLFVCRTALLTVFRHFSVFHLMIRYILYNGTFIFNLADKIRRSHLIVVAFSIAVHGIHWVYYKLITNFFCLTRFEIDKKNKKSTNRTLLVPSNPLFFHLQIPVVCIGLYSMVCGLLYKFMCRIIHPVPGWWLTMNLILFANNNNENLNLFLAPQIRISRDSSIMTQLFVGWIE